MRRNIRRRSFTAGSTWWRSFPATTYLGSKQFHPILHSGVALCVFWRYAGLAEEPLAALGIVRSEWDLGRGLCDWGEEAGSWLLLTDGFIRPALVGLLQ